VLFPETLERLAQTAALALVPVVGAFRFAIAGNCRGRSPSVSTSRRRTIGAGRPTPHRVVSGGRNPRQPGTLH